MINMSNNLALSSEIVAEVIQHISASRNTRNAEINSYSAAQATENENRKNLIPQFSTFSIKLKPKLYYFKWQSSHYPNFMKCTEDLMILSIGNGTLVKVVSQLSNRRMYFSCRCQFLG